jgi:hypothetical protein
MSTRKPVRETVCLTVVLPLDTCEVFLRAGMMPDGVSSAVARAIDRWNRDRKAPQRSLFAEVAP